MAEHFLISRLSIHLNTHTNTPAPLALPNHTPAAQYLYWARCLTQPPKVAPTTCRCDARTGAESKCEFGRSDLHAWCFVDPDDAEKGCVDIKGNPPYNKDGEGAGAESDSNALKLRIECALPRCKCKAKTCEWLLGWDNPWCLVADTHKCFDSTGKKPVVRKWDDAKPWESRCSLAEAITNRPYS